MITVAAYLSQHGAGHESELTDDLRANAQVTVDRANMLLEAFGEPRGLRSGWRPRSVNDAMPNAAHNSWHITCEAIDLDDDDRRLQEWCMANLPTVASIGLWLENPIACPTWLHAQIVPPRSRQRVFFPNSAWARRALEQGVA